MSTDGGACLETCLSMLLKIPAGDFPFYTTIGWSDKLNTWLIENHGIYMIGIRADYDEDVKGLTIAVYKNPDGKTEPERTHAVLYRDHEIIYDPSHGRWYEVPGKKKIDYFLVIVNHYQ